LHVYQAVRLKAVAAVILFVSTIGHVATAQDGADNIKTTKQLVDPRIAQLADGLIRTAANASTEAYLPILYPTAHASNLIQLKNGDVLCFWFSGTWEGNSNVGIVMSRLKKGTDRWEPTKLIDRHMDESYQNPVAYQAPDGTIYLFHTTQPALKGEGGARTLEVTSRDDGATWTQPVVLFGKPGSYPRNSLLVMKNGAWLLGMNYQKFTGKGIESVSSGAFIQKSSNQGKTWKECPVPSSQKLLQPSIVYRSNGTLLAYLRSAISDHIYASTSTDGCNWTAATPTALPNNHSGIQLLRLKNGHLLLIFNNSNGLNGHLPLRKPLSAALSNDDGATWSAVRDIEAGREGYDMPERQIKTAGREEYSYPAVIQRADGKIMVSFTFRRQTIKVVTFDESWVRQGGTSGLFKGGATNP
jgi:predicted neuraminidase